MRQFLLILLATAFVASAAHAQGRWVNSIADLGYSEPGRIGSYYQQGGEFFAVFSCIPGQSGLLLELGFPTLTSPELLQGQIFLQADGVNVFPQFQTTVEQGFLQAYPKPGLAGQTWAGQERVAALLQQGVSVRIMAIGDDKSAVAYELARLEGAALNVGLPAQMQKCNAQAGVPPVAETDVPAGDSTPPQIGLWQFRRLDNDPAALAMYTRTDGDAWDELSLACGENGSYGLTIYSDGGPGGIFRDPATRASLTIDGAPAYIGAWKVAPYTLTASVPAVLLGDLKVGRHINFDITNGMKLAYALDGFSEAFAVLAQSCKAVWEQAQPWRRAPGFINLVASLQAQIQEGCAKTGMGYEILPSAFQTVPGKPGQIDFNYGDAACIGDGWPTFGAGFCGAGKCQHTLYQIEGDAFREVGIYLR